VTNLASAQAPSGDIRHNILADGLPGGDGHRLWLGFYGLAVASCVGKGSVDSVSARRKPDSGELPSVDLVTRDDLARLIRHRDSARPWSSGPASRRTPQRASIQEQAADQLGRPTFYTWLVGWRSRLRRLITQRFQPHCHDSSNSSRVRRLTRDDLGKARAGRWYCDDLARASFPHSKLASGLC